MDDVKLIPYLALTIEVLYRRCKFSSVTIVVIPAESSATLGLFGREALLHHRREVVFALELDPRGRMRGRRLGGEAIPALSHHATNSATGRAYARRHMRTADLRRE